MTLEEILKMPTDTIKNLKKQMDELRDSLLNLQEGSDGYNNAQKKLQEDQDKLNKVMAASKKTNENLSGSYNALSAEMSKLKKEWKATNDEAKRKELGDLINSINDKLKSMDASVGVFSRNVGNYQSAFEALGNTGAGAIVKGAKGIKGALDVLKAHPIIAIIAIAVTVLMKIADAFKKNEVAMNNLKKAMAPLKGVIDAITFAFDKLVENFSRGLVWISEGITKMMDFLNIGKEARQLEQDIADLEKSNAEQNRQFLVENSKLELEVAELRAKAADKANESAKDRIKYITEAGEKQKQIAANNLKQAQDELELIKKQGDTGVNDAEMNDKIAQAQANVYKVQQAYNLTLKETNAQISLVTKTIKSSEKAASDAIKKRIEDTKKATKELEDSYNSIVISMISGDRDKFIAQQEDLRLKDLAKYKDYLDKKLISQEQYNKYVEKYDEHLFNESIKWEEEYIERQDNYIKQLQSLYLSDKDNKINVEKEKWNKVLKEIEESNKSGLINEEQYQEQVAKIRQKAAIEEAKVEKEATTEEILNNLTKQYNAALINNIKDDLFVGLDDAIRQTGNQILLSFATREITEEETNAMLRGLGIDEDLIKEKINNIKETIIVQGIADAMYQVADIATELGSEFDIVFEKFSQVFDLVAVALKDSENGWTAWGQVAASTINAVGSTLSALAKQQDVLTEEGFEQQKKLQIAATTMNMLGGIVSAVSSAMNPSNSWMTIWGQIALAASTSAMVLGVGLAQIADIKKQTFGSSGSTSGANINANAISSTIQAPVQYTEDVNGANIEQSLASQKIYVSVEEINDVDNKVRTNVSETRF